MSATSKPGKLVPPYPQSVCANLACDQRLSEETGGAYLFKNRLSGKLCVLCESCTADVELNHREQFALVEL